MGIVELSRLNLFDRQQQYGSLYCTRRRVVEGNVCCQAVASFLDVFITRRETHGTGRKLHAVRLFCHTALLLVTVVITTALMSDSSKRLKHVSPKSTLLTAPSN
jgi:hypothetical protein